MDEAQITESLKAKIERPAVATVALAVTDKVSEQATVDTDMPLEPMIGYKLADIFGMNYDPKDNIMTDRLDFVYRQAIATTGSNEYTDVANYIRSLIDMLGARTNRDPLYTIYQWLRLDDSRKKIEEEMKLYAHWG
jgi:hypothetical protein